MFKEGFINNSFIIGFYLYGEYCLIERDVGVIKINDFKRFMRYNFVIYCVCLY